MKTFSPSSRRIGIFLTGSAILAVIVATVLRTDTLPPASGAPARTETARSAPPVRFTGNGDYVFTQYYPVLRSAKRPTE